RGGGQRHHREHRRAPAGDAHGTAPRRDLLRGAGHGRRGLHGRRRVRAPHAGRPGQGPPPPPVRPPGAFMRHLALRRVLSLALLVAALAACGKKGDPRPPILLVPAPTTDLTVTQRGDQLLLELAYPQTTAAGTPLPGLGGVTVWELAWR